MYRNFISFFGWTMFHCMERPQLLIFSVADGHLDCFHLSATVNSTAVSAHIQVFVWPPAFSSLAYRPWAWNGWVIWWFYIYFLKTHQTDLQFVFQPHWAKHPKWQCTRAPISPHLSQHFLLSLLLIMAILMALRWYHIVVFVVTCCLVVLNIFSYTCSVQSLSHVWPFATPWTAACQASLSITKSWSLLKLMCV